MNSKEALEKMLTDLIWYESYFADCGYYDNKEQFDIIKFRKGDDEKDLRINGKCPYFRILIHNKHPHIFTSLLLN